MAALHQQAGRSEGSPSLWEFRVCAAVQEADPWPSMCAQVALTAPMLLSQFTT
eukprot:CAMPEP_0168486116 /NCGR_PEP_ID=MMETSP0228-20121227/66958_1 /TAXON_ID=133427 /ORGANISM="Protoceratium reticulatum, Strain CCCM 535 (=CCMP 1889)" /LENGTH=52 /DNA_ID=CAMNT_0008502699 /DNA_START=112 /DNA_END=267 /DNA_ORIENTATION=+